MLLFELKYPSSWHLLKGCLPTLLTSLAKFISKNTWIFIISWEIYGSTNFDLHFSLKYSLILQSLFGGVPIGRFGWNFVWMHKIWFRKIFIPASRLYDLFENPRSLEAARGRGHFWHPETRGSHLSTIYGVKMTSAMIGLGRPRVTSDFQWGRTASRLE